jgi:hypothetical protein
VNPALQVQAARAELGLGELELTGHVRQVTANVAAVLVEYVPAAQSVHAALPILILYLPATQAEQTPPFGPVNPALQVQSPAAELALNEIEFEGQSVHATLPVLILYLPATQAEQTPPFGPVNPALQVQSPAAELALYEIEFEGHVIHVVEIVAPVLVEYVPVPQSVHAALPVLILYLPVTQALHELPSGPVKPALHVQAARVVLALGELELLGHA